MNRVYNFSAGPSMMPLEVLEQAQKDLLCYPGAGCSVMEMSHRSPSFEGILHNTTDTLRRIMSIPDDYEILFLQGGATMQFSMTAMNLAHQGDTFCYMQTGQFATKAKEEGARWGNAVCVGSSKEDNYSYIPKCENLPENAKFLHITGNNTIFGTAFNDYETQLPSIVLPQNGEISKVPLVADWSSAILGKWIDVDKHGLIYAGAQKNCGPAGLTIVIIRKDLLEKDVDPVVPIMLRYKVAADNESMYNTPPTFAIYMAGLMFDWVEKNGGVKAMEEINVKKSSMLYDYIDNSKVFANPVNPKDRSIMNVTFTLPSKEATEDFLNLAKSKGMINLKGHRFVGGCRASIYNGMTIEGVELLVDTMKEFEKNYK
ncbi:MAG: 3-phosphoserine/phosphohydroxythreonine transaminase [Clostridia bacterium]|nr:3-phosphoserine/phosphohydroxythreonine transaminase [Clostridia bacterium]